MKNFLICLIFISTSILAQDDSSFFDPAYPQPIKKIQRDRHLRSFFVAKTKNDVHSFVKIMSPVKSQKSRGTCSIFSSVAVLESSYIEKFKYNPQDVDLSEEWVEFIALGLKQAQTDGSWAYRNWEYVREHGIAMEATLPYIGENWLTTPGELTQERCGHIENKFRLTTCLITHWDPILLKDRHPDLPGKELILEAKKEASESIPLVRQVISEEGSFSYPYESEKHILDDLDRQIPIILELDVFYGAWNHRKAEELGLERDMDLWHQGLVGSVIRGSVDEQGSRKMSAGHSLVLVGYDLEKEITNTIKMPDGTNRSATSKGVYYFKNSWGMESFGKDFQIDEVNYPGYGAISIEHAQEFGRFYKLLHPQ